MRKLKTKKWLSVVVSCALLLPVLTGMLPGGVSAGGCTHVCGDGACAYSAGTPCGHHHDADCGWDEDALSGCAHNHDADCGYVKAVSCDHTHDASCGELNTDAPDEPGDPGDGGNNGPENTDPEPPEGVTQAPGILLPTAAVLLTEKDAAGGGAPYTVTFTITGDEVYDNTLYLPRGIPVTDAALLKGVAAVDENGLSIPVTIQGVDGLDRHNPQPQGGFPPQPYVITCAAVHPVTGELFTATRAVYVTVGIKPAAYGDTVPVTGVTLVPSGKHGVLTAIVEPVNATNKDLIWTSSHPSLVTVTQNGVFTEIAPLTALVTITVTTADGVYSANYQVNESVNIPLVASIRIATDRLPSGAMGSAYGPVTIEVIFTVGQNHPYTLSIEGETGLPPGLNLNETSGVITGIPTEVGTYPFTILAETPSDFYGGNQHAKPFSITISAALATGVTLDTHTAALVVGQTQTRTATVNPDNAYQKVNWTSSNADVATVDDDGNVTAVSPGTATITAATTDNGKTAACAVTVNKASTETVLTSGRNPSLSGDPMTLTATVTVDSPGGGHPTGTVLFKDGLLERGSCAVDANGIATLTLSDSTQLNIGSYDFSAQFSGDANYAGSASAILTHAVKYPGAPVSGPPTASNIMTNSITVNTVTNAGVTGQAVEYAISTTSGTPPTSGWQSGTTFNNLAAGTTYYVCARTAANSQYDAGVVQWSMGIRTPVAITGAVINVNAPVIGNTQATTAPPDGTGYTCGPLVWTPTHNTFQGNTQYTVEVTLSLKSGYTFADGLEFAQINGAAAAVTYNPDDTMTLKRTFPATGTVMITGMSVKAQPPKLACRNGDALDLSGLAVTLSHNDLTVKDILFSDFSSYGISVIPAHGTKLDMSYHGKTVEIALGGYTAYTNALQMAKAAPTLTLNTPSTVEFGQTVIFTAALSGVQPENGNREIVFNVAGADIGSRVTGANGEASVDCVILKPAGMYKATASFAGDAGNEPASITASFTVKNPTLGNGTLVEVPEGSSVGNDDTITFPPDTGGKIILKDGEVIDAPGGTIIDKDGTIHYPVFSVIFSGNGGTPAKQDRQTTDSSNTVTLPAAPARGGYTFAGWNTALNGTGTSFTAATKVMGDTTVYAKWRVKTAGNVSGPSDSISDNPVPLVGGEDDESPPHIPVYPDLEPDGDGVLTVTNLSDTLRKAIDQAIANGQALDGIVLELICGNDASLTQLALTLDPDTQALLQTHHVRELKINLGDFYWSLDEDALNDIRRQTSDGAFTVNVWQVDPEALSDEVRTLMGGRPMWEVGISFDDEGEERFLTGFESGKMTLWIRYSPSLREDADDLYGLVIPEEGEPQTLTDVWYEDGWMVLTWRGPGAYGVMWSPEE